MDTMISNNINSNVVRWVYHFLSNRTQRVKSTTAVSKPISTSTGTPQGCSVTYSIFSLYEMLDSGAPQHAHNKICRRYCTPGMPS